MRSTSITKKFSTGSSLQVMVGPLEGEAVTELDLNLHGNSGNNGTFMKQSLGGQRS